MMPHAQRQYHCDSFEHHYDRGRKTGEGPALAPRVAASLDPCHHLHFRKPTVTCANPSACHCKHLKFHQFDAASLTQSLGPTTRCAGRTSSFLCAPSHANLLPPLFKASKKQPMANNKMTNPKRAASSKPRNDRVSIDNSNTSLSVGTVHTVEADLSLQQFPAILRSQIEDHLKTQGATLKPFSRKSSNFKLRRSIIGEPTEFVEPNADKIMDCAIYEIGYLERVLIVVVQPRPPSVWNDGKPAIIVYYGKGMRRKNDLLANRHVSSRWAVWTPSGVRNDLVVERLVVGTDEGSDEDLFIPEYAPAKCTRSEADLNYLDDRDDMSLHMNQGMQPIETNVESEDQSETQFLQAKRCCTGAVEDHHASGGRHNAQGDGRAQSSLVQQYTGQALEQQYADATSIPRTSVEGHDLELLPARQRARLRGSTRISSTPLDPFLQIVPRAQTTAASTIFSFGHYNSADMHMEKGLDRCNSVHKLFAYAYKAGIVRAETMILRASIGPDAVHIVRDDDDDFGELMQLIQATRQQMEAGDFLRVHVTPC